MTPATLPILLPGIHLSHVLLAGASARRCTRARGLGGEATTIDLFKIPARAFTNPSRVFGRAEGPKSDSEFAEGLADQVLDVGSIVGCRAVFRVDHSFHLNILREGINK
jgi:hypothetical protein